MIYCFNEFELDELRFELRKGGERVRVEPKVLDLILLLVRARDRVVLKRELLEALWADVTVSDASIWRVVLEARRALRDEEQRIIVTLRGRGFRFAAPVTVRDVRRPDRKEGADANTDVGTAGAWPSARPGDTTFVGREASLAAIDARIGDVLAGRGRAVWLNGEPGMGKTRTAEEIARTAEVRGAKVLAAQAHEDAPAFWVWAEILRAHASERDDEPARTLLAKAGPLLRGEGVQARSARFALFEAISHYLTVTARERSIVFVFDDLHAADEPSLRLLEFLARDVRKRPWLIVGTYRDGSMPSGARGHALGGLIATTGSLHVPLRRLSLDEVARLVEMHTLTPPSTAFATAMLERSGGNPLYVEQLLQTEWAERALRTAALELASSLDLQRGIIETIGRHLDSMSAAGCELLTKAAVLGKEFHLAELCVVSGLVPAELLDRLDEAVRASLVFRSNDGSYRFAHVLVRDVLYKRLSSAARAALHHGIGEKLLAHYADAIEAHATDLAEHFLRALPEGDPERAIEFGTRAAELEERLGRYKTAAKFWQRTVGACALLPREDARRVTVQLGLAQSLVSSGRQAEAREAFLDAAILGQTFARPQQMAEAALAYTALAGDAAGRARPLLEESLAALADATDEGSTALRKRVEATLVRSDAMVVC
jgi:DNA-binding winged helix-turn-helix (wHTH) protein